MKYIEIQMFSLLNKSNFQTFELNCKYIMMIISGFEV